MAKQTIQQLHTEIGVNRDEMRILRSVDGSTTDAVLVHGGNLYPGLVRWSTITHSDNVTTQVAAMTTTMAAAGTS